MTSRTIGSDTFSRLRKVTGSKCLTICVAAGALVLGEGGGLTGGEAAELDVVDVPKDTADVLGVG